MRRPILAGNWKMNKTRDEAIHFVLGVDYKLPILQQEKSDFIESKVKLQIKEKSKK